MTTMYKKIEDMTEQEIAEMDKLHDEWCEKNNDVARYVVFEVFHSSPLGDSDPNWFENSGYHMASEEELDKQAEWYRNAMVELPKAKAKAEASGDPRDWDFYSDFYKDFYGYRPIRA